MKTSVNIKLKKSLFKTQSAKKKTMRNLPPFAQETMTLGDNEQTFGNDWEVYMGNQETATQDIGVKNI